MRKIFTKRNLRICFIIFYIFVMITGAFYAYLVYNTSKSESADIKNYRIPYEALPDNCGVLFAFPDNAGCLFNLDFTNKKINGVIVENIEEDPVQLAGYTADYTVSASYELIAGIIDKVGGVELDIDGELLRYTGVQIIDMISVTKNIDDIRYNIIIQTLQKISENGFSKDDFSYIIEYGNTDLTIPICYEWDNYIKEMCGSVNILR